jgi:ribonuclease III
VTGFEPAIGRGRSKREAEQSAAAVMLRREGVWEDEGNET